MKTGIADIAELLLPPEDGALARALANLDAKLSTWRSVVVGVQGRLTARPIRTPVPESSADRASEFSPTGQGSAKSDDGRTARMPDTHTISAAVIMAGTTDSSPTLTPSEPATASQPALYVAERCQGSAPTEVIDEEELLAALDPEMAEAIRAQRRHGCNRKTMGELIAENEKSFREEEALLRTLEPAMATAIRIQKRFFGGRKSVRELIAEYKPETKQEQKSWWKKVKEGAQSWQ